MLVCFKFVRVRWVGTSALVTEHRVSDVKRAQTKEKTILAAHIIFNSQDK